MHSYHRGMEVQQVAWSELNSQFQELENALKPPDILQPGANGVINQQQGVDK